MKKRIIRQIIAMTVILCMVNGLEARPDINYIGSQIPQEWDQFTPERVIMRIKRTQPDGTEIIMEYIV